MRYLPVTRLCFALVAIVFSVYMIPGLWGAPLKAISAFVPPMGTQDFIMSSSPLPAEVSGSLNVSHPVKYYEQMKMYEPEVVAKNGLVTYYDYDEALEAARISKKPLMLDFTGINCVNCRKMEGQVWSDARVMEKLKKDFVIVSLYVDAKHVDLPVNGQYFSKALEKEVETLGDKNTDLQVTRFGANTQPYYFFLDHNQDKLVEEGYGYDPGIEKFLGLLDKVSNEYKRRNAL
jgi:thioredoxin-related protein